MSNRSSPEPKEVLGKLCFRSDDLDSLKCLVAIRMTKKHVQVEPLTGKNAKTSLVLADGSGALHDPFAIAWFLSAYDHKTASGNGSQIMQWNEFSKSEIRPFLNGLLKEGHVQRRDVARNNTMRKVRLIGGLDALNKKLMNHRFLIGSKLTLADVLLAADLTPLLDPGWCGETNPFIRDVMRKDFAFVKEWYSVVIAKNMFRNGLKQFLASAPRVTPPGDAKKKKQPAAKAKASSPEKEDPVDLSGLKEKPLRVLCIHGFRQNEATFKDKLGAFRKIVGKYVDFHFITAPHNVIPMSVEDINQDQRGWWFSRESGYFKSDDASDCDKGFSESLDLITKTFELHGPFDGILGFSQGAALAALLCLMKTREPDAVPAAIQFQFAVLVAGFKSLSSKHAPWYAADGAKVKMPTLHVIGTEDRVIRKSVSEALLHHFQDPDKLYHSGGHYMVATAKQKRLYYRFLSKVHALCHPQVPKDTIPEKKPADENLNTDKIGPDPAQAVLVSAV